VLGPAIAAISLRLVGHADLGERIGRNARFASIGCIVAAGAMGAIGDLLSKQAVFLVTGLLVLPTLFALWHIRIEGNATAAVHAAGRGHDHAGSLTSFRSLLTNRRLILFACCILLFHLANAAILPLMGGVMAHRATEWATLSIAACMIVPQLIVAAGAPWVGRTAVTWGRRPLLAAAFVALALRCVVLAFVTDPYVVIAVQALDGVSAAVLGVMFPLVVADITRKSGGFSLGLGIVGSAVGIGAALSTTLGGYLVEHIGHVATFLTLGGVGVLGLLMVSFVMPETRPDRDEVPEGAHTAQA
jgi:predicted MFS family arabinose efflux permease